MGKIFFCSDLHLGHNKPFLYEPRGFKSIKEHDEAVINNINNIIGENDTLYSLGDEFLTGLNRDYECFRDIKCKNILIIRGNHTTDHKVDWLSSLENVKVLGWAQMLTYKKWHFYLSHYPSMTANNDKVEPWSVVINLHGHTHSKEKFGYDTPYMYNVAIDAHNNCPISIDDIMNDIRAKAAEKK